MGEIFIQKVVCSVGTRKEREREREREREKRECFWALFCVACLVACVGGTGLVVVKVNCEPAVGVTTHTNNRSCRSRRRRRHHDDDRDFHVLLAKRLILVAWQAILHAGFRGVMTCSSKKDWPPPNTDRTFTTVENSTS